MPFLSRPDERFGGWSGPGVIGEKTGQLIGERIYDKFSKKPSKENKGEQIVELLKSHPDNTELQTNTETQRDMKQESLSQEFDKLILM